MVTRVSAPESTDAVTATRQTYIQESLNFTGAELAARLPSMQAAMRQRDAAAGAVAAAASASAAASSSRSPVAGSAWSVPGSRAPAVPAAPPVTRPGPAGLHPAASVVSAGAAGPTASPAAPFGSRPYTSGVSMSAVSSAATAPAASPSTITMQVAEVPQQEQPYSPAPEQNNTTVVQQQYTPAAAASAPVLPAPDNLQGLSASEKMQALQQVQQASRQALSKNPASSPYYANAPKTIDIRMYDQLVVAHNKLSQKLSDGNAHIGVLEAQINQCNEDLIAAFELMKQIAMEFGTTSRLAQGTAAAVQFGVDPQDALDKIGKLQERLSTLEQAVLEQRAEFGKRVVRKVPVEWIGVASEVKVMGDFDDWTRGHELSAEDVATDSVYSRFEGTLLLRPGKYRVKFLVDNQWRLAADWPTERDEEGNEVCLLTVT